jgi:hypothetical protein
MVNSLRQESGLAGVAQRCDQRGKAKLNTDAACKTIERADSFKPAFRVLMRCEDRRVVDFGRAHHEVVDPSVGHIHRIRAEPHDICMQSASKQHTSAKSPTHGHAAVREHRQHAARHDATSREGTRHGHGIFEQE